MPRTSNRLYFARRAEQSAVAVAEAVDPGARLAHRQLRAAYALLANSAGEGVPVRGTGALFARPEPTESAAAPVAALAAWANEGGTPE
jgi:hypothetical protein